MMGVLLNPVDISSGRVPRWRVEQAEFDAWLDRKRAESAAKYAKANAVRRAVRLAASGSMRGSREG